jgi:porin
MPPHIALAACLTLTLLWASPALADDDEESSDEVAEAVDPKASLSAASQSDDGAPAKIGVVHDVLRRTKKQESAFQKIASEYADLKTRMEDEHGLTWSFSLSYRQRWVSPNDIGTSSQTLFWPTVNWDIFDSETYGSGSFQFLYYGERRSGSSIKLSRGSHTLSAELPDYQNRFSQITYTHTLPGEKLALAVGQYSFFNFDSSEFMADQQLNFVNNIFSANGSATYPSTGLGAYLQFNATKNLQFLAGGQSFNADDPAKRPSNGLGNNPNAWLGYVQWTPSFKGLGDAQYSLTLYQVESTSEQPQSRGWSINAVQHLNDQWAVFGRLNASSDDGGGNKRSYGAGLAMNNPLGRDQADQIGIAFGSLEQTKPLSFQTLKHTQNTLEAYWNWSLIDGLLLTPDAQYIRNPAFAPNSDSAWIVSLRTTLVF